MSEVPFWALSPSPFTLAFYTILTFYAYKKISKGKRKFRTKIKHLLDAAIMVGFIVILLDSLWIVVCGFRFGWFYQSSILALLLRFMQNILALTVFYVYNENYFKNHIVDLTRANKFFTLNMIFLLSWFMLSPTPAFTDWTFAIRHNYSVTVIAASFLISHVLGKTLVALIFRKIWNP